MQPFICLIVVFAAFLVPHSGWAAEQYYDLGGPCGAVPGTNRREIDLAQKSGAWDQVVELEKAAVRGGCGIAYRWHRLVAALLQGHREAEAVLVFREMDSRGFDLNPSIIGSSFPQVEKFMEGNLFRQSSVGVKTEGLRAISDERRAKFRELLKTLPQSQRPPENYIAKGVCPFECCRYGNWTVLENTDLVAAPGSRRVVGRAMKGSLAVGLTGEVHTNPEPVVVVLGPELGRNMPKDSIAFVLDYGGEGFGHVFTQGKVIDIFLGYENYCFRLSESCWGERLIPSAGRKKQVWWVKVRLPNGTLGWTDQADHFGGQDACG